MRKVKSDWLCVVFFLSIIAINANAQEVDQSDLILYWAPVVYQDMDGGKEFSTQLYTARDAIVAIDFDGELDVSTNWDNSHYQVHEQGALSDRLTPELYGISYGSFVESQNYYFLGYGFYHAGDDAYLSQDRHQNDWEMIVIAVNKDGSAYGELKAMMTQSHTEEKLYAASDFLYSGSHPIIAIQPNGLLQGHGIVAWNGSNLPAPGNDAVVYNPAKYSENVTNCMLTQGDDWSTAPQFNYKVLPIDELWGLRGKTGLHAPYYHYALFNYERSENTYDGSYLDEHGGNLPWDRTYLIDPIVFFSDNFDFLTNELNGESYVYNPYYSNDWGDTGPFNDEGIYPEISFTGVNLGAADGLFYKGADMWSISSKSDNSSLNSDSYRFEYQQTAEDIEISAQINSIQRVNNLTNAGLMIRDSLTDDARMVYLSVESDYSVTFVYRNQTGSPRVTAATLPAPLDNRPVWIKLRKTGDFFQAFYSYDDPKDYQLLSSQFTAMTTVYTGVASASESSDTYALASLTNLSISYPVLISYWELDGNTYHSSGLANGKPSPFLRNN